MTYSRRDLDTSWADTTDDDDDQPQQRHSGMDHGQNDADIDPAAALATLPPRGGTAEMPGAMASFDDLGERPSWHSCSPPAPVAEAWAALEAAVEAAVDAGRAEGALTLQQASAERTEAARVRSAIAAGKSVKPSTAPDWSAGRRHLAAVSAGHRDRARRVRAEYDDLVLEHRAAWSARIIALLPDSKAATLKALATAGLMVERLLADAEAAQALLLVEGGSLVALPVLPVRRFLEAMQALAQEIEASAPLGGDSLVHPRMDPPYRDREQISASIRAGVVDSRGHWLADLERREGYRNSSLTRGIPLGDKPSEDTAW